MVDDANYYCWWSKNGGQLRLFKVDKINVVDEIDIADVD